MFMLPVPAASATYLGLVFLSKMVSMLDSIPVFEARLRAVGVSEPYALLIVSKGINTMAKLAWASSAQPGMGDEKPFIDMLVASLNLASPTDLPPGELSSFRRIWFEAHTVGIADIRQRLERTEESAPRRLPVPERAAKLSAQKAKLVGVNITGHLVPSHSLVDFVMTMRDDEQLRYVDPDRCTTREQELLGVKREQFVKPDSQGMLRVAETEDHSRADLTTEHRVRLALQRRSLALDQCDLMGYSVSESYHDFLYGLVAMTAPPGFRAVDIVQILNADRAIWARMSEYTNAGISLRADGTYPIEAAPTLARVHPMVACLLQPLPRAVGGGGKGGNGKDNLVRSGPYEGKAGRGKGGAGKPQAKAKSKGKGKSKGNIRMPFGLIGCKSQTNDGSRICFDFNLPGGCAKPVSDGKCPNGVHACCGCLATAHGYQSCA